MRSCTWVYRYSWGCASFPRLSCPHTVFMFPDKIDEFEDYELAEGVVSCGLFVCLSPNQHHLRTSQKEAATLTEFEQD